ncbi:MAG: hypothetical protein ACQ9MH_15230 [Nitrospinales bacterium]
MSKQKPSEKLEHKDPDPPDIRNWPDEFDPKEWAESVESLMEDDINAVGVAKHHKNRVQRAKE